MTTTSILSYQLEYYFSGGASNALGTLSLGGTKSSVRADIATWPINDPVFNSLSLPRGMSDFVDYRCLYIHNANPFAITWEVPRIYIVFQGYSYATPTLPPNAFTPVWIEVGVGTSGANGVEQTIPDAFTAPTGVTFYSDEFEETAARLIMPNIPAGGHHAFWVKRVVNEVTGLTLPSLQIRIEGGRPVDITSTAPAWQPPMVNLPPPPNVGGGIGPLVGGGTSAFSVTNTNGGTQNTHDVVIALTAGQTLKAGTDTLTGASAGPPPLEDTNLTLMDPSSVQVAFNEDISGSNYRSYFEYVAATTGNHTLKVGAWSSNSAEGTVAWEIYDPA